MEQVRVAVCGLDPITLTGLTNCLDAHTGVTVLAEPRQGEVDVVVAAFDWLSSEAVAILRNVAAQWSRPIVLVINEMNKAELLTAVECRVVAILPRTAATDERLVKTVGSVVAGGVSLPPNLLGQLVDHLEQLHREVLVPSGLTASGLSPREVDVLRLMADGHDTIEIAHKLRYSERTVKNIIYAMTNRLRLRNRPHAVAYAVRVGVI